jgi:hypothetical protein
MSNGFVDKQWYHVEQQPYFVEAQFGVPTTNLDNKQIEQ